MRLSLKKHPVMRPKVCNTSLLLLVALAVQLIFAGDTKARRSSRFNQAEREYWAFQPVSRPEIPAVGDRQWIRNPIDAFILAQLEAMGLRPSPPADRTTCCAV
jgi:hypothetical protein